MQGSPSPGRADILPGDAASPRARSAAKTARAGWSQRNSYQRPYRAPPWSSSEPLDDGDSLPRVRFRSAVGLFDSIRRRPPKDLRDRVLGAFSERDADRMERLCRKFESEILASLNPLFGRYASERHDDERFGDFAVRIGAVAEVMAGREFHHEVS